MRKKVEEVKSERRVTREVRYFIFEKSEKGKLKQPMERKTYDYEDSEIFDSYGYDTEEKAFDAIENRAVSKDNETDENGWARTFFGNGKTYEMKESYFVLPRLTVTVWWEKVD